MTNEGGGERGGKEGGKKGVVKSSGGEVGRMGNRRKQVSPGGWAEERR